MILNVKCRTNTSDANHMQSPQKKLEICLLPLRFNQCFCLVAPHSSLRHGLGDSQWRCSMIGMNRSQNRNIMLNCLGMFYHRAERVKLSTYAQPLPSTLKCNYLQVEGKSKQHKKQNTGKKSLICVKVFSLIVNILHN